MMNRSPETPAPAPAPAPTAGPIHVKCVLVGDNGVGKTSLLIRYTTNLFPGPDGYTPIVFDNYTQDLGEYHLALWDTHVHEEHDFLRARSYPDTNIFLICFSVVNRQSFENAQSRWVDEISTACPETPWVLVGLKTDRRDGERDRGGDEGRMGGMERTESWRRLLAPVTAEEGRRAAQMFGASAYVECSSEVEGNVRRVFEEAILASQHPKPKIKQKGCCVVM
ncbi:small GTPase superfamily [Aspergillus pseudoustus]|uniref:Small GTPase superfamily n=1 Tax=Aspergillus pseudoustus TaxID=1810923 RepID=A0ABR4IFB2_9EURO